MANHIVIETGGLTKQYNSITAVRDLNLTIQAGEVFGLLGPNGAGKTTTILMLLGLTEPSRGTARVLDLDPARNPLAVKREVGYLPDNVGFYEDMTGRQNLRYSCRLNDIPGEESETRIQSLLERVGLKESADRKVGEYSRGMRQRLGMADVLIKQPQIIILDEPTLGIDPEGMREMTNLIRRLSQEDGMTVLLSSHLLHQVQEICDRVGIFVRGQLIAVGPIRQLSEKLAARQPWSVQIEVPAGEMDRATGILEPLEGVRGIEPKGSVLVVQCESDIRPELVSRLTQENVPILHLQQRAYGLDEIYRQYFREGEAHASGNIRST